MLKISSIGRAMCISALWLSHNYACAADAQSNAELIRVLVEKGVISAEEGKKLLAGQNTPPAQNTLRVPYVPQSVKDELGKQVREGVKEDVTAAVMTQAKREGWGLPGAQPEWISRLMWGGDFRLRAEDILYAEDNADKIPDYQIANEKGGVAQAGAKLWLNSTEDRERLRARLRLSLNAAVAEGVTVKTRLATGNQLDPVSTNQTLGSYGEKSTFSLDQGYINWQLLDGDLDLNGGRMGSPFITTDLVWDADLAFDGISAKWNYLGEANDKSAKGFKAHILAGAFPIQEFDWTGQDKWLYAAEAGASYLQENGSKLKMGVTLYTYDNMVGAKNELNSDLTDFTAPKNLQRGNSLFNIRNSANPTGAVELYALASDYQELGFTTSYDIATATPQHIVITADYVTNIGYDAAAVQARMGVKNYAKETKGYKLEVLYGALKVQQPGDWNASFAYRHLERDAVLDAFADSDFLQGGTDNKGFILSGEYGLRKNLSVKLNVLSASSIDKVPADKDGHTGYQSDVVQLDLNARF